MVIMSLVVAFAMRVAASLELGKNSRVGHAQYAVASAGSSSYRTQIKKEHDDFRKQLEGRFFQKFLKKEDESAFANTVRDRGLENLQLMLGRTTPSILLAAGIMQFVVIEGVRKAQGRFL